MSRLSRRQWFRQLGLGAVAALATPAWNSPTRGEDLDPPGVQIAALKDQLEKGLKARRPVEFQFLGRVLQLVSQGQLTRPMVLSTYDFVIKKYRTRKYLVPAFEMVLRKRLKEQGSHVLDRVPGTV